MAKVLTVQQPFAELIVINEKHFETRSYATKYRGELFIHSSLKADAYAFEMFYDKAFSHLLEKMKQAQLGAIIGKVEVIGCYRTDDVVPTKQERAFGDWREGRWAWELSKPVKFEKPIFCKGNLGIWNCDLPELEREVSHA